MSNFIFPMPIEYANEDAEIETNNMLLARRARLKEVAENVSASLAIASQMERDQKQSFATESTTVAFRLPNSLLAKLNALAEDSAIGRSQLIRQIVFEHISNRDNHDGQFNGYTLRFNNFPRR